MAQYLLKAGFHSGENKDRKYFNSLPSGLRITGSNWNRKLVPRLDQFCSDPVRSHAYFPEWKSALMVGTSFPQCSENPNNVNVKND